MRIFSLPRALASELYSIYLAASSKVSKLMVLWPLSPLLKVRWCDFSPIHTLPFLTLTGDQVGDRGAGVWWPIQIDDRCPVRPQIGDPKNGRTMRRGGETQTNRDLCLGVLLWQDGARGTKTFDQRPPARCSLGSSRTTWEAETTRDKGSQ